MKNIPMAILSLVNAEMIKENLVLVVSDVIEEECGHTIISKYRLSNPDLLHFQYRYFFMRNLKLALKLPVASSDRSLAGVLEDRGIRAYCNFKVEGDVLSLETRCAPIQSLPGGEIPQSAVKSYCSIIANIAKTILSVGAGVDNLREASSQLETKDVLSSFGFLVKMNEQLNTNDLFHRILNHSLNEKADAAAFYLMSSGIMSFKRTPDGIAVELTK